MTNTIKSTDWRGVPCTMVYTASGEPVKVGGKTDGGSVVEGGQAPHKDGSTGYVSTDRGSYYVGTIGARWVPDFEPKSWAVYVNDEPLWWVGYDEPLGYLAAHGVASFHKKARVQAVEWE
jgi:hypothetical protein